MNYQYIIALLAMLLVYFVGIYFMKYIRHFRLFNLIFICAVFLPYVMLAVTIYKSVGFYDWNFQNKKVEHL